MKMKIKITFAGATGNFRLEDLKAIHSKLNAEFSSFAHNVSKEKLLEPFWLHHAKTTDGCMSLLRGTFTPSSHEPIRIVENAESIKDEFDSPAKEILIIR